MNTGTNQSKKINEKWLAGGIGALLFVMMLPSILLLVKIAIGLIMVSVAAIAIKVALKTISNVLEDKQAIVIILDTEDESGKDLNCTVVLDINFGKISIEKSTINSKNIEPKEVLELAKQSKTVLIKGKALHKVLAEHFIKQTPCEEKKSTQSHENIVVPGSGAPGSAIDEEIAVEHPSGKAANKIDKVI